MKVLDLAAAKQKAFRLLSMRPHSEKELEKKLREKGFPAVVIKETLEKLYDLKYLNGRVILLLINFGEIER